MILISRGGGYLGYYLTHGEQQPADTSDTSTEDEYLAGDDQVKDDADDADHQDGDNYNPEDENLAEGELSEVDEVDDEFAISVSAYPYYGGYVSSDIAEAVEGEVITLTAVAAEGFYFAGWEVLESEIELDEEVLAYADEVLGNETGSDRPVIEALAVFEMPDTRVDIRAVFEPLATDKCDFAPGSSPYRSTVYLCGFPVIRLDSDQELSRDLWRPATLNIDNTSDEFMLSDVNVTFRGRGNSTWSQMGDKRPLRFRFPNNQWQTVFDAEAAGRDWLLIANVMDPSFLRNYSAFELGRMLGTMPFTANSWFVHLYLNGEYYGVFTLTEERDATPGRGDLNLHPDPAISEYMIENDFRARHESPVNTNWVAMRNQSFDIRHAGGSLSAPGNPHALYVRDFLARVDAAIVSGDQARVAAIVDIPSIVDSYIIHELFRDKDIGLTSQFFQIRGTGADRRLFSGPLWDFDRSSGTTRQSSDVSGIWAGRDVTQNNQHLDWYHRLLQTEWFSELVTERMAEVTTIQLPELLQRLDQISAHFEGGFARNFERWPNHLRMERLDGSGFGSHGPISALQSAREHQNFLVNFLRLRGAWLNDYFSNRELPQANEPAAIIGGQVTIRESNHLVGDVLRADIAAPFVSNVTGRSLPMSALRFQWYRSGRSAGEYRGRVPIEGATARTYRLTADDVGHRIDIRVWAERDGYLNSAVRSAWITNVRLPQIDRANANVFITGNAAVGQTLQAVVSGSFVSSATGRVKPNSALRFQWYRGGTTPAHRIVGGTRATHQLTAADIGHRITVRVWASRNGYLDSAARSASIPGIRMPAGQVAPTIDASNVRVTISGSTFVGQRLTADIEGNFISSITRNNVNSVRFQWYRGDTPITGATSRSYRLTDEDLGERIFVRVHAVRNGYPDSPVRQAAISGRVQTPTIDASGARAVIIGQAQIGQLLRAEIDGGFVSSVTGRQKPNNSLQFQWYRGGVGTQHRVRGATGRSLRLTAADMGQPIFVRVSASRAGYVSSPVRIGSTTVATNGSIVVRP